MTKS
jgi:hypothetical protein